MEKPDIPVAPIVGPYTWGILQHAVETFPCKTCSEAGRKFIHGIHDLVNIHLGKPVKFPADLQWLKAIVDREVPKVPHVQIPHNPGNPGNLDKCVQQVTMRQCPHGVKTCKVNPFAVCKARAAA